MMFDISLALGATTAAAVISAGAAAGGWRGALAGGFVVAGGWAALRISERHADRKADDEQARRATDAFLQLKALVARIEAASDFRAALLEAGLSLHWFADGVGSLTAPKNHEGLVGMIINSRTADISSWRPDLDVALMRRFATEVLRRGLMVTAEQWRQLAGPCPGPRPGGGNMGEGLAAILGMALAHHHIPGLSPHQRKVLRWTMTATGLICCPSSPWTTIAESGVLEDSSLFSGEEMSEDALLARFAALMNGRWGADIRPEEILPQRTVLNLALLLAERATARNPVSHATAR